MLGSKTFPCLAVLLMVVVLLDCKFSPLSTQIYCTGLNFQKGNKRQRHQAIFRIFKSAFWLMSIKLYTVSGVFFTLASCHHTVVLAAQLNLISTRKQTCVCVMAWRDRTVLMKPPPHSHLQAILQQQGIEAVEGVTPGAWQQSAWCQSHSCKELEEVSAAKTKNICSLGKYHCKAKGQNHWNIYG